MTLEEYAIAYHDALCSITMQRAKSNPEIVLYASETIFYKDGRPPLELYVADNINKVYRSISHRP